MANQGIYREAGPVPGLPLPRTNLSTATTAVGVAAGLALFVPVMLFVGIGGGVTGAWQRFREGGFAMYLVALLGFVAPLAAAALGVPVARGKRVPAVLLLACAAAPFVVSLFGTWFGQTVTVGVLRGDTIDPETRTRILAEGFAESMANDVLGGLVTCGAALVACIAAAGAAGTLDVTRVAQEIARGSATSVTTSASAASAPVTAMPRAVWAIGGVWFASTIAMGAMRLRDLGALAWVPALPLCVAIPALAFASCGARVLHGWHDRGEANHALGALVVSGAAAVLGVLALQRSLESHVTSRWLSALASESADTAQRLAILQDAVRAQRLTWPGFAVHTLLGGATFTVAWLPALRGARGGAWFETLATGCTVGLLAACALGVSHMRDVAPEKFATAARASLPQGITLPTLPESLSGPREHGGGVRVVVTKDGPSKSAGEGRGVDALLQPAKHFDLYADEGASLANVRASLPAERGLSLTWYAKRGAVSEQEAKLGPLAYYLGLTRSFEIALSDDPYEVGTDELRVVSVTDDAIEIDEKRTPFPLEPAEFNTTSTSRKSSVRYTFRPQDTVGRAVRVIETVERARARQLMTSEFQRTVVIDDGSKRAADMRRLGFGLPLGSEPRLIPPTPGTMPGPMTVSGRLPPEVIQRIVRLNFARFRKCYEDALQRSPGLEGRVTVRFVIDTSGAVASASDAGSTLGDAVAVQCLVRGFKDLTFPKPEGGIVIVVYPIVFKPKD